MPPFLLMLWANKYARYAAAGIAVVILLLGIRAHFIHQGKEAGKEEAKAEISQDNETQRQAVRSESAKQIEEANHRAEQAQQAYAAAVANEAILAQAVSRIGGQRQAASEQLGKVADHDLHAYTVQKLSARASDDKTVGYTLDEERKIAQLVTDYPLLQEQLTAQSKQMQEVSGEVAALGQKVSAVESRYDALNTYTTEIERDYVILHNLAAKKRPWILRIFGAKPKKLPVPDPKDLRRP